MLWLTTPTEEVGQLGEGASGRSTGGAPPGSIAAKVFQAKELLQETGKASSSLLIPLASIVILHFYAREKQRDGRGRNCSCSFSHR